MLSSLGMLTANILQNHGEHIFFRALGIALLLISPCFFIPPFYILAKSEKTGVSTSYMHTSILVKQSVYRIVRHPQYLGYILLNAGIMLIVQSKITIVLMIISIGAFIATAQEEEKLLEKRFGDEYVQYSHNVPRFNFLIGLAKLLRIF